MIAVSWLGAALLGAMQGLTEFLPVSSSGHLALLQQFVDAGDEPVMFDLVLHIGTLIPAIWFYRERLSAMLREVLRGEGSWLERPDVRIAGLVLLATITTAVLGLPFKDALEARFDDPAAVGSELLITAIVLLATAWKREGEAEITDLTWWHAVLIGIAQAIAIAPGISRSGMTIAAALFLGVRRVAAVEFSFLMMMPAIVGAALLQAHEVELDHFAWGPSLLGAVTACVFGYLALAALVRIVMRGGLYRFAIYLVAVAAFAFSISS